MDFSFRPATVNDIKPCLSLFFDRFAFRTRKSLDDLVSFWRYAIPQGIIISAVTEERRASLPPKVVALGMSLFVTDKFAQECKTTLSPYTSLQVIRRWKAKHRVFLTPQEISSSNSSNGLNILILHYGVEKTSSSERFAQVNSKMGEAFYAMHAGYKLKEFLYEVYGDSEKKRQITNGLFVRRDYHELLDPQDRRSPNAPYFLGITRAEATIPQANFGMSMIFSYTPPRFGFSPAEKLLLQRGLAGESDQEMASYLKLSIWTVKKGWQRIYARVEKKDPGLMASGKTAGKPGEEASWAQRRRKLLEYLRTHMEEIRPGPPPRRGPLPKTKK